MTSKKKINKESLLCSIISNYSNKINTKNLPPSQIIKGEPNNVTTLIDLDDSIKIFNDFNKQLEKSNEKNIESSIDNEIKKPIENLLNNKISVKKIPINKGSIKLKKNMRKSRKLSSVPREALPKGKFKKGGKKINKNKKRYTKKYKKKTKKHMY